MPLEVFHAIECKYHTEHSGELANHKEGFTLSVLMSMKKVDSGRRSNGRAVDRFAVSALIISPLGLS